MPLAILKKPPLNVGLREVFGYRRLGTTDSREVVISIKSSNLLRGYIYPKGFPGGNLLRR